MAPIRRYLRISAHSVLECRIYLENPSLADTWLLNSRDPLLPRIIESVRPLVLPKLREEDERSKGKGKKGAKGIKDVIVKDEFQVAVFLTDPSTRHSLLRKQKHFLDPKEPKLASLRTQASAQHGSEPDAPISIREDLDEHEPRLPNLSSDQGALDDSIESLNRDMGSRALPRTRYLGPPEHRGPANDRGGSTEDTVRGRQHLPEAIATQDAEDDEQDAKKLVARSTYDGYSIYRRVLCLVVKRRTNTNDRVAPAATSATIEEWITSTQIDIQND